MSRISKLLLCLLAVFLAFSAVADENLIDVSRIEYETAANYKTVEVKKGVYQKVTNSGAQAYYPIEHVIRYEGATAQFVDFHVKRNDEIKVGDLLATFSIQRDEVRITRMNMEIETSEENYRKGLEARNEQLKAKDEQIALAADAYAREIYQLERRRLEIEMEKYVFETENAINDQKEALDELLKTYENTNVYSEVNGIVSEIVYFRDLAYVHSGTQLMKVYDPSVLLYRLDDSQNKLRYNMEALVSVGRADNRVVGYGRVVACPMALPGGGGDTNAYVRVDEFPTAPKTQTSPYVSVYSQYLENVYVVDRAAVSLYSGKYFVYKLSDDGMVSKRYVGFAFGSQQTGALLVDGVTDGDKLIIDE